MFRFPDSILFQDVANSIYNGIIIVDHNGIVVLLNKAGAELLNCEQDQIAGSKVNEFVAYSGLLEVIESGAVKNDQRIFFGERQFIINNSPVWHGGTIVGAVCEFQCVDETGCLSKQIQELNMELESLIDSVGDGIVVCDGKGYVIRINNAYQKITGITKEEYIGKHVHELLQEGYIGHSASDIVIERKTVLHIIDIRNSRELLMTSTPVFNGDGDVVRVVTLFRDLEDLNNLKKQLACMENTEKKYREKIEHSRLAQVSKTIITNNPSMKEKTEMALMVAKVNSTVLILGESGTGKELFAQLVHRASPRARQPFIKVNCGAMPESLLESELFGYEAGTFTGASRGGKMGLFELANGGTLFLDEIGELPLQLQVKLLRALHEREIRRIGGKNHITLDIRFIAATNRCLEEMVRNKTFREDLYYRLNVVPLVLPPLRERKEDIFLLIADFLDKLNRQYGLRKWIHSDLMRAMVNYNWPGNVRELQNVIERLFVTCRTDCINISHVIPELRTAKTSVNEEFKSFGLLRTTVESEEKKILLDAYKKSGNTRKAAEMLGISQSSVVKKLRKYGIARSILVNN